MSFGNLQPDFLPERPDIELFCQTLGQMRQRLEDFRRSLVKTSQTFLKFGNAQPDFLPEHADIELFCQTLVQMRQRLEDFRRRYDKSAKHQPIPAKV